MAYQSSGMPLVFCEFGCRSAEHFVCSGTARTSLVVTIGPSPRHRGETSSTIMFGQRVGHYHHSFVGSCTVFETIWVGSQVLKPYAPCVVIFLGTNVFRKKRSL